MVSQERYSKKYVSHSSKILTVCKGVGRKFSREWGAIEKPRTRNVPISLPLLYQ